MPRGISLGKFCGIPVRLHYTWLPAIILITVALSLYFHGIHPLWLNIVYGTAASLLFFASICARELARGFVASNRGMPLKSITLYVFGGVLRIAEQDIRPVPELLIAITGLTCNLVVAGIFYGLHFAFAGVVTAVPAQFMLLMFFFNLMIALFNVIPAFPLDGGRGLRAILLLITGDYSRATRIAVLVGRVAGIGLILAGILQLVLGAGWFAGTATVVLGWFLEDAAMSSRREIQVRDALRGITAHDMMTEEYTPLKQQITFGLVREYIISSGQQCFAVIEDGKLRGLVTLGDTQIPQKLWDSTRIGDIMTPTGKLLMAHPEAPAADLLEQMNDHDIDQIPVVREDKLIGMVTRERLLRFLKARAVLKA